MELAAYTLEPLRTDGEFILSRGRPQRHPGASFAMPEHDVQVAQAGLAALGQ
jgi:hypothetical protein